MHLIFGLSSPHASWRLLRTWTCARARLYSVTDSPDHAHDPGSVTDSVVQSVGGMNRKAAATNALQQHIDSIRAGRPSPAPPKPSTAAVRHVDWRNSARLECTAQPWVSCQLHCLQQFAALCLARSNAPEVEDMPDCSQWFEQQKEAGAPTCLTAGLHACRPSTASCQQATAAAWSRRQQ